jgi:hypothetical protein
MLALVPSVMLAPVPSVMLALVPSVMLARVASTHDFPSANPRRAMGEAECVSTP